MELKEFIKETIIQIFEGIQGAQEFARQNKCIVVPENIRLGGADKPYVYTGTVNMNIDYIEFEVGLTSAAKQGSEKGIGVLFGSIGIGGKTKDGEESESVTRVKFSLPVVFPPQSGNLLLK